MLLAKALWYILEALSFRGAADVSFIVIGGTDEGIPPLASQRPISQGGLTVKHGEKTGILLWGADTSVRHPELRLIHVLREHGQKGKPLLTPALKK